ncbi:MAG: hypothetical protein IKE15_09985 [Clostridia bacterium]|nr:hypothetical protein [Clostridia bacterium]
MKNISKKNLIRLLAAAGTLCLVLTACFAPDVRADQAARMLVIADADSLPEGAAPADPEEIGKLLDTVELPDALEARFREEQPVWAELTAPVAGLALTEDGKLLAFTAAGDGNAAQVFGFAEMADGLRFAATVDNEALGLRLGEVAVSRTLLIDGRLWYADETGICTLQETPQQDELERIRTEYETAGAAGGIPSVRPDNPLPADSHGAVKPQQNKNGQKKKETNPSDNGKKDPGSDTPSDNGNNNAGSDTPSDNGNNGGSDTPPDNGSNAGSDTPSSETGTTGTGSDNPPAGTGTGGAGSGTPSGGDSTSSSSDGNSANGSSSDTPPSGTGTNGAGSDTPSIGTDANNNGTNHSQQEEVQPAPGPYHQNVTIPYGGLNNQTNTNGGSTVINNGGYQEQVLPFPDPQTAPANNP